jgi:hypothetical protein
MIKSITAMETLSLEIADHSKASYTDVKCYCHKNIEN